jgi:hypothetical protein
LTEAAQSAGDELCIIDELLRWLPRPEGGVWVIVDDPFLLAPGDPSDK